MQLLQEENQEEFNKILQVSEMCCYHIAWQIGRGHFDMNVSWTNR